MKPSIKRILHHAMAKSPVNEDAETLERVGRSIAAFVEAQKDPSVNSHPETFIIELPVQDHETARRCFDVIALLQEIYE
jgi:hypothetical protein